MSNDIRNILNIKDPNITFSENCTQIIENKLYIKAKLSYTITHCPHCHQDNTLVKNETRQAKITLLNTSGRPTFLLLNKQRYRCKACYQCITAKTNLGKPNCSVSLLTKQFIMVQATKSLTEKDITHLANFSSHTVRRVIDFMGSTLRKQPDTLPDHLCFDEFKSTKSVKAAIPFIFCDTQTHQVIDIIEDRKLSSLKNYFYRFSRDTRKSVKTVTMDMYLPYIEIVKQLFPNTKIIIDHFHLVQALNRELNRYRIFL